MKHTELTIDKGSWRERHRRFASLVIVAILASILAVAFASCEWHVDPDYKVKYSRNKIAILGFCVEQYKKQYGTLPKGLEEIAPIAKSFLEQHEDISTNYLKTCWTRNEVATCELAPTCFITYVLSPDKGHYYLAAPLSVSLKERATYEYIEKSMTGDPFANDLIYVIHDGRFVYARFGPDPDKMQINDKTLEMFFVAYKCKGHSFTL